MKSKWIFLVTLLYVSFPLNLGQTIANISSCNCVSFRLSNIQDFYLSKQQIAIINTFKAYQVPLTIGIAGDYFGVDSQMVNFIREAVADPQWQTEIACNGFQYKDLASMSQIEQTQELAACSGKLEAIFGKKPSTLIPPLGSINQDTLISMQVTGFTHLSGIASRDPGSYPLKNPAQNSSFIWRFPADASTSNMTNSVFFSPVSAEFTWAQIQTQIQINGFAVVDINPYEFATYNAQYGFYNENVVSEEQINQLIRLIYLVRAGGKRINLVTQIDQFVDVPFKPACVAFRLDDTQDYYMTNQQISVINLFQEMNIPLSIGFITNNFGRDIVITNAIRNLLSLSSNFEVCSHGWNHEDFSMLSVATQSQLLGQIIERIQSIFGVRTKCFVPPFNAVNDDTFVALVNNGFTILSSEVDQDPAPYNNATNPPSNGLWRYPIQAATAVMNQDGYYVGVPASSIINQIETQIAKFGFAAVMMHPYEFGGMTAEGTPDDSVLNQQQITELRSTIFAAVMSGKKLVTLGELKNC